MGKFLDGAKKAAQAGKKAAEAGKKAKQGADKAKQVGDDLYNEDAGYVVGKEAKKATKKATKKLGSKALKGAKSLLGKSKRVQAAAAKAKAAAGAAKGVIGFLVSNPIGWIISIILIVMLVAIGSNSGGDDIALLAGEGDGYNDNTLIAGEGDGYNDVTTEEYVSMFNGCPPNLLSGGPSSSLTFEQGQTDRGLDDVVAWMSSPISTTWNVDLGKAEALFLKYNPHIASRYSVTESNIREVSLAIQNEGVSPQFFWMYAVEEGGGHGGYINHFTEANASSDRIEAAKNDARKIRESSNDINTSIATGGGITPNMPTAPAIEILDMMPAGSIGRAYLKMTAAATAEIVHLNGNPGSWSPGTDQSLDGGFGTYGPPLNKMMTLIEELGGDPYSDTQMINLSMDECYDQTGTGQLVSGGMNLEQAYAFMYTYYETPLTAEDVLPAAPGTPIMHANCTAFVSWFLKNHTSIVSQGGDGGDIVPNLVSGYDDLEYSDVPTVYGVFSVRNQPGMTSSEAGHTGIILGIDTANDEVIVGHALYGMPFTSMDNPSSGVNAHTYPLSFFEGDNWTFVDISAHINF